MIKDTTNVLDICANGLYPSSLDSNGDCSFMCCMEKAKPSREQDNALQKTESFILFSQSVGLGKKS